MEVKHPELIIKLEGEEERRYLQAALILAYEIGTNAVRHEKVSGDLIRAGIFYDVRDSAKFSKFADELSDML